MSTTENPSSAPHPHRTADTPLTPERWQRIKEVFADVQERDPSERAAFLANACAADESLHSEVESLLAAAESEAAASVGISSLEDLMIGRRVGAYKIIRRIGRGGMATVYLASRADEQYEKQVAIKILLPELGTEELLRRFRNERQTLAKLDHPNIVKLLDGGSTEEGLPYLVMDYVQGVPIDQYCDNHKLSTAEDGSRQPGRGHHRRTGSGQDDAGELDPDDSACQGRQVSAVRSYWTGSEAAHRNHGHGSEDDSSLARN
jgi:hypothetical protein